MKIIQALICILICAFAMLFLCGSGLFLLSFIGLTFDDVTGSRNYFMWSFS